MGKHLRKRKRAIRLIAWLGATARHAFNIQRIGEKNSTSGKGVLSQRNLRQSAKSVDIFVLSADYTDFHRFPKTDMWFYRNLHPRGLFS